MKVKSYLVTVYAWTPDDWKEFERISVKFLFMAKALKLYYIITGSMVDIEAIY